MTTTVELPYGIEVHPDHDQWADQTYYERHELSDLFGPISENEFEEMYANYEANPTKLSIAIYEGKILDGWHRFLMCLRSGKEPFFWLYTAGDPAGFVRAHNMFRRHLTASQRASIVVALHEWAGEGRPKLGNITEFSPAVTTAQMSEEAQASEKTVTDARTAERGGLGPQVRAGEMSASAAANQTRQKEREGREVATPPVMRRAPFHDDGFHEDVGGEVLQEEWETPATIEVGEAIGDQEEESEEDDTPDYGNVELDEAKPTQYIKVELSTIQDLEATNVRLAAQLETANEKVRMLSETNSPDPETSTVVANQRSLIQSLESSNRRMMIELDQAKDLAERQKHMLNRLTEENKALEDQVQQLATRVTTMMQSGV